MSSLATLVPGFGATVTQQLWVVSLQTGRPRQLFHGSSRDTRPAFSQDSRRIAFSSDRSGEVEIWVADADGNRAPEQITSGRGGKTSPAAELTLVNVASKASRTLHPFPGKRIDIRDPSWR